jgi:hypothetical protein
LAEATSFLISEIPLLASKKIATTQELSAITPIEWAGSILLKMLRLMVNGRELCD